MRGGTTSYYHADGLGSITSLSNPAGALAQTYGYDLFGKQTTSSGSLTNPFRFTARDFDTETNLQFSRARYFDPATGRFLSEDPVRFSGGANFYSYVSNNPVYWIDPLGLTEGSPSNLAKRTGIDKIAQGLFGSQVYNFDKQKGNFPPNTNKCNKFVCDVVNEAGTPMLVKPKGAAPRCARAGEIANPNWTPNCWPHPTGQFCYVWKGSAILHVNHHSQLLIPRQVAGFHTSDGFETGPRDHIPEKTRPD